MQPKKILPPQGVLSSIDGYECVHVRSEPVHEVFQSQTAWQGTVEVFKIIGHPKAKHAYSWAYEDDDKQLKTITVLEIPPVDSAQTAVKVAIAAKARK
jgi:hypothetical protein